MVTQEEPALKNLNSNYSSSLWIIIIGTVISISLHKGSKKYTLLPAMKGSEWSIQCNL